MLNIIDYLKETKDELFAEREFNELDALILSRLSYIDFRSILGKNKYFTKRKLTDVINDIFLEKEDNHKRFRLKEDKKLLDLLRSSLRFRNLYIKSFVYDTNIQEVKQFCAVTFTNEEKTNKFMFVSYKGTDGTLTGWKEDFNMAYQEAVPAQIDAVNYLRKITRFSSFKTIYVGGHSKGGNLAVYASSLVRKNIQKNIKTVFSFDGPGFQEEFLKNKGFKNIQEKIVLYTPQSSIIGRLLYRDYKTNIIHSKKKLLYQHNVYNWEIENLSFISENKYTFISNKITNVLLDSLKKTTLEERKQLVDELFDIVKDLSKDDVIDFGDGMLDFFKRFATTFKTKNKATQELLLALFNKTKEESPTVRIEPIKNENSFSKAFKKIKGKFENKKTNALPVIDFVEETPLPKEEPLLLSLDEDK